MNPAHLSVLRDVGASGLASPDRRDQFLHCLCQLFLFCLQIFWCLGADFTLTAETHTHTRTHTHTMHKLEFLCEVCRRASACVSTRMGGHA